MKMTMPASWPAAKRLRVGWPAITQNLSFSLLREQKVRKSHFSSLVKPECVKTGALGHVPNSDALVLAVAQDQLLPAITSKSDDNGNIGKGSPWVEDGTADIVVVTPACVHLPSLMKEGLWL